MSEEEKERNGEKLKEQNKGQENKREREERAKGRQGRKARKGKKHEGRRERNIGEKREGVNR